MLDLVSHFPSSLPVVTPGYAQLAVAAFGAGALNAVAGGGSFFSFPALLGMNLPPVNANATNTVALWPGQLTSIVAFRRELRAVKRLWTPAIICAIIGGLTGAVVLLFTKQSTFMRMVPWLLLFATVLFGLSGKTRQWLERRSALQASAQAAGVNPPVSGNPGQPFSLSLFFWLTLTCVYVGFFGAGAGFLFITVFSVVGGLKRLNEANALKVLCNLVANGVAVVTFIVARAVHWREGLFMLVLAGAGGYVGAAYSRGVNPRYLRLFIIAAGLALSAYYFAKTWL